MRNVSRTILAAVWLLPLLSGCGPEAGLHPDGAPVVRPDSEQGRKAIAEREQMLRDRAEQEARARKRRPALPHEG